MTQISARSPTRVDLAGGTLDLWPIYTFLGNCTTVNVAIDIYTYATLTVRNDKKIHLEASDLSASKTYENLQQCLNDDDGRFLLLRRHIEYWKPPEGFELKTKSESPVGGGLGGSSSLSISLIGAFSAWLGKKLSTEQAVRLASNIEAQVLHVPTGTQDYYPALLGGLNVLKYSVDGCEVERLNYPTSQFEPHFLLVYTGKPHQSGLNNWQVLKDCIEERGNALTALEKLKLVARDVRECFATSQSAVDAKFKTLLNHEYEARVMLSEVFTSGEIERLRKVALESGAEAVKICGAGGGGCVLVWCPTGQKEKVQNACQNAGFQVLNARPVSKGLDVQKT